MIIPTKKRLTRIFTAVALSFSVLILSISYFFVHYSSFNEMKRHLNEDIEKEFLEQFYRSGLDPLNDIWNEHRYQILNKEGHVIVSARNSKDFYPVLNRQYLQEAFLGHKNFEHYDVKNELYLVAYFPIDGKYVGRAAVSLTEAKNTKVFF